MGQGMHIPSACLAPNPQSLLEWGFPNVPFNQTSRFRWYGLQIPKLFSTNLLQMWPFRWSKGLYIWHYCLLSIFVLSRKVPTSVWILSLSLTVALLMFITLPLYQPSSPSYNWCLLLLDQLWVTNPLYHLVLRHVLSTFYIVLLALSLN